MSKSKCKKTPHVRTTFGRSDVVLRGRRKGPESEGFVAVPKALAAVAHFKRVCKDTFSVTGAVQETCPSEMLGGPGGDFLRGVAFWSIKSSVLGK